MGSGVRTSQAERILEAKQKEIKRIYKERKGWNITVYQDGEHVMGLYKGVKFPIIEGSDDGNRGDWVDYFNLAQELPLPEDLVKYLEEDEDDE